MDSTAFLTAFGYLDPASAHSTEAVQAAVAVAQGAYGLPVTGDLDPMTEKVFDRTPRCGMSDAEGLADGEAFWGLTVISWHVASFPVGLGYVRQTFEADIAKSFSNWSAIIPRDFKMVLRAEEANIVFHMGRGRRANFDGKGGTLAYMEVCPRPNYKGVLSGAFDGDEPYGQGGILVENVGTHEIGHALGFMHAWQSGQLMSSTYSQEISKPQSRDRERAQSVYGVRTTTPPPPPPGTAVPAKAQILMADDSVWQFENPTRLR